MSQHGDQRELAHLRQVNVNYDCWRSGGWPAAYAGRISGHSQTDVVSLNAAGDLPYEDYCGLIDRPIGIEDTMRVKAAKRPDRPKKRDKCEKLSG